ncbi:hypothetical protein [Sulfitobacter aestuariivivens]|uniref:Uncharacterized protein n=1 Tax=Sulfitobacter aestuariivivens TaxID=2766981 RepID=A0A927D7F4_9RHOB|nr:hypothetical protein [Sulfitobacter aestuariivivens]MBD3664156.1 hypothetical protein [Sulfitobacter aestuariivivens]
MALFRIYLFVTFAAILAYTVWVIATEGPIFLQVAIGMLSEFKWPGQFTLDFAIYLYLSMFWIMWRNEFSAFGIVFGLVASVLGAVVLLPYLIYLSYKCEGDVKLMLIGPNRM